MTAYSFTLHAHSGLRWLVLLLAIVLVVKSLAGLFGGGKYSKLDNVLSVSFVGTMHLQLLIGLILYFFLSPITDMAFKDFGSAMKDSELRFWAVEHLVIMILAVGSAWFQQMKH
jgi:Na+-driven multidrug efflux pump